jgi:hypothetical protein
MGPPVLVCSSQVHDATVTHVCRPGANQIRERLSCAPVPARSCTRPVPSTITVADSDDDWLYHPRICLCCANCIFAPMSTTSPMSSAAPTSPLVYTASVNPPRKAKRARAIVDDEEFDYPGVSPTDLSAPPPSSSSLSANRPILPRARVHSPVVSTSPKATRTLSTSSAPPANLTRAQRESLRKQNHSRIEKARRTKINDALAALRLLVPKDAAASLPSREDEEDEEEQDSADEDDPEYVGRTRRRPTQSGRPRQEKEFKLEVLVRTVSYLNTLISRVAELEQAAGSSSSTSVSVPEPCSRCLERDQNWELQDLSPRKRRRSSPAPTSQMDITQHCDPTSWRSSTTPSSTPRTYNTNLSQTPSQSPSLPPISSWLPLLQTQLDPSAIPAPLAYPSRSSSRAPSMSSTPMMSAYGSQGTSTGVAATRMYPSPPPSDPLPPRMFCAPPSLMLPPSKNNGFGAKTDEDAASLLLRLRSPGRGSGNGFAQAQTPASLLGLGR